MIIKEGAKAVIYTDASFCHQRNLAACGYCIVVDGELKNHNVYLVDGLPNSTQAESTSIMLALQDAFEMDGIKTISVNTDCLTLLGSNNKIRPTEWNEDLIDTIEVITQFGIGLSFNHVVAHRNNQYNKLVDYHCHDQLKQFRVNFNNKNK